MAYIGDINNRMNYIYSFQELPDDYISGDDDNQIIANGTNKLFSEYLPNKYNNVYIRGEGRTVTLSDKKQEQIYDILLKLCGADMMEKIANNLELQETVILGNQTFFPNLREYISVHRFDDVNIDDFYRLMMRAGRIIGGNNDYLDPVRWMRFLYLEHGLYEKVLAKYNMEINDKFFIQEGVSGGLARPFAAWMSIVSLLLGGMVSIFYLLRDKKSEEVLSAKSISSFKLFIIKYTAVNIVLLIPLFILAAVATVHAGWIASEFSVANIDVLAFFKVSLLWVLPTNMFATAFSMLITTIADTPVAAIILASIWFIQALSSPAIGSYDLNMMLIRFSTEFSYDLYNIVRNDIIINRLFYTGISFVLIFITVWFYHLKRRGKWNAQNLFRNLQKKY
jgi:hypothetical protein